MGLQQGEGLSMFRAPLTQGSGEEASAMSSLDWPHLTVCMDMGPDGFAAYHYAQRVLGLNMEALWDASHGGWRDFQRMIRDSSLMCYWLIFLVVANVGHGPFLEDSRFNGMQEAMRECWSTFSSSRCALFGEYARNIGDEAGVASAYSDEALDGLWDALPDDPCFVKKDYKCNMNRFWHGVERAWTFCSSWTKFLYFYSYMAIETDVLNSTILKKLVFRPDEASASTSSAFPGLDDRALRGGQVNALATSVLFLAERSRFYKLRAICKVSEPVEKWHRGQARRCRSAYWLSGQVRSGFMAHINELAQRLLFACPLSDEPTGATGVYRT